MLLWYGFFTSTSLSEIRYNVMPQFRERVGRQEDATALFLGTCGETRALLRASSGGISATNAVASRQWEGALEARNF